MRENYINSVAKVFDFTEAKVLIISSAASFITILSTFSENYFGISGKFALALAILILADFITGVLSAWKQGKSISSGKGLRTVYKTGAYMLFLFIAFTLQDEVPEDAEMLSTIIKYFHIYLIAHISFWELFSVDENLKKLGINLGLTDYLKAILDKLRNVSVKPEDDNNNKESDTDEGSDNSEVQGY